MATAAEKSKFLTKVKQKTKGAWKKKADSAPKARGSTLPEGVVMGTAQVSSYRIGEYDDGTPYVSITGIIKEPAEYAGQRVPLRYVIKETDNKTVEQVVEELTSDLQFLGVETAGTSEDDIPKLLDKLVKDKPHFYFNTKRWNMNGNTGVKAYVQEGRPDPIELEGGDEPSADADEPAVDEPAADEEVSLDPTSDDEAEGEFLPAVEDQYSYKPAKQKARNVEVTKVNESKKTVDLKEVDNEKKIHKGVKFDDLAEFIES